MTDRSTNQASLPLQDDATTSGTDRRPARDLDAGIPVDLRAAARDLLAEETWPEADRNARTLSADERLRVTLVAARDGATIGSPGSNDTLAIQVIEGAVVVDGPNGSSRLPAGRLVAFRPGRWQARADGDSVLLLTVGLGAPTG